MIRSVANWSGSMPTAANAMSATTATIPSILSTVNTKEIRFIPPTHTVGPAAVNPIGRA